MQFKTRTYSAFSLKLCRPAVLIVGLIIIIALIWTQSRFNTDTMTTREQKVINYIAKYIELKITVGDNLAGNGYIQVKLINTGDMDVSCGPWRIYFNTFATITTTKSSGFAIRWVNGGLYYLSPIDGKFMPLHPRGTVELRLEGWKSVARSDHFPNWYVASSEGRQAEPKIIECTKGEHLAFVDAFETLNQWKRQRGDTYNPYSPADRYKMNRITQDISFATNKPPIIPSPLKVSYKSSRSITVNDKWVVLEFKDSNGHSWSGYLAAKLGLPEVSRISQQQNHFAFKRSDDLTAEEYRIDVLPEENKVLIFSSSGSGAFYGSQTILGLLDDSHNLSALAIHDKPRFKYRGLMVDVVRNFQSKEAILKLIDVLAMYKMNKLHLHLTDDEGWRIEIPEIPELTTYGSRRCHFFDDQKCLIPSLGSGPFLTSSGTGFYSVSDFREILRHAKERHIQVIPEVDIPGHSRAAVLAVQYRELNANVFDEKMKQPSYLLLDDVSKVSSVQGWVGNAMNPCLNATYRFLNTVFKSLKATYEGIQDLEILHIGGDEVPFGIWQNSQACIKLFHGSTFDHASVKRMFILAVAEMAEKLGMNISLWEDGIYNKGTGPFNRNEFKQKEVYVNAWNNIWTHGNGGRAIEFANSDYNVILSMATNLYLDHPYEPDPEERGLYWATRYIDTYTAFGFMPMNIFANAEYDGFGNAIDTNRLCGGACPVTSKPDNIVGMEACVWSETIRTEEQLHSMLFPRLLAVAERAWHRANWEDIQNKELREEEKMKDWIDFSHSLSSKELTRLESLGIKYRVPPPGMVFDEVERVLFLNNLYPDHEIMISYGSKESWNKVGSKTKVPFGVTYIYAKSVTPHLKRESRVIHLSVSSDSVRHYLNQFVFLLTLSFLLNH